MLIPSYTFEQFKATLEENTLISYIAWKSVKKKRHAVLFTAVNQMFVDHYRERDYDVTKPRIAVYKHNWENTPKHSVLVYFEGCSE